MVRKIKVLMYGPLDECLALKELFESTEYFAERDREYTETDEYDDFKAVLIDKRPTLVVVLANKDAGMEAVYFTKHALPTTTVFWFSDDSDYVMQSHKMNCGYFATKPVTVNQVEHAINRCTHVGVFLDKLI